MKKMKFLAVVFLTVCVVSCGPSNYDENVEDDFYKKISTGTMSFSKENGDPDLYMFVYNKGDATIEKDKYKDIFKSTPSNSSRVAIEEPEEFSNDDFDFFEFDNDHMDYTCGLSLETVQDAYKNFKIKNKSECRATNGDLITYDRAAKKTEVAEGSKDYFWAIYKDDDDYEIPVYLTATCRYVNEFCQVFVSSDIYNWDYHDWDDWEYYARDITTNSYYQSDLDKIDSIMITERGVEKIADSFSKIYKPEQELLGKADLSSIWGAKNIIETSEKITILVTNLGKNLGNFYPYDLRCDVNEEGFIELENGELAYTNQRLMISVNTCSYSEQYGGENELISTLAHEFNHMLNYINKGLRNARYGKVEYETWFTEMLSLTAEDVMSENLSIPNTVQESRLRYFLRFPYSGMVNWESELPNSYKYGYAYAFGAYLVRNYGGIKFLNNVATNSYSSGKDSINRALSYCGYGKDSYSSVLQKFGKVLINPDGTKYSLDENEKKQMYPTLNKMATGKIGKYTYTFPVVDLYSFGARNGNETVSSFKEVYTNPNWTDNSTKGPCFYNNPPANLYGGGFYAMYLGKASDYDYKLKFNPPSSFGDLQAFIFTDYN